jgi:hypothetical protein
MRRGRDRDRLDRSSEALLWGIVLERGGGDFLRVPRRCTASSSAFTCASARFIVGSVALPAAAFCAPVRAYNVLVGGAVHFVPAFATPTEIIPIIGERACPARFDSAR